MTSTKTPHDPQPGTGTRERLLDAAEKLFAERGFEATSVRELTAEAGCNLAAINYHFGGKDHLYHAAFSRLLSDLRAWRDQRLRQDLEATGGDASLESFLESFAVAFFEPLESAERRRRLDAWIDWEIRNQHLPPPVFLRELVQPIRELGLEALRRFAPPMDPDTAALCLMSLMGQLMHARRVRSLSEGPHPLPGFDVDLKTHIRQIVRYAAAGIRACAQTRRDSGEPIRETNSQPSRTG